MAFFNKAPNNITPAIGSIRQIHGSIREIYDGHAWINMNSIPGLSAKGGGGGGYAGGSVGDGISTRHDAYNNKDTFGMNALAQLAMRLRWKEYEAPPFNFINVYLSDTSAFIFIAHKGQAIVLEDDPVLYPSDTLVTKIRVLLGNEK